jgi:hypothetical protein
MPAARPFIVGKRAVSVANGRSVKLDSPIQGRRMVDGILILLLAPDRKTGRQAVLGVDRTGRVRWRRSSWVPARRGQKGFNDQYVALRSFATTAYVFTGSCHRIAIRPRDGKVIDVTFTK